MPLTILIAFTVLLAWHDGCMYLLRGKSPGTYAEIKRTNTYYHISGALLNGLVIALLAYYSGWQVIVSGLLVRLSIFDILNNYFSGLPVGWFGSEAVSDKIFKKVFKNAVIKSVVFLIMLIIFQIILYKTFD